MVTKSTLRITISAIYPPGKGIGLLGKFGTHTFYLHNEFNPQQNIVPQQVPVSQNDYPPPILGHSDLA